MLEVLEFAQRLPAIRHRALRAPRHPQRDPAPLALELRDQLLKDAVLVLGPAAFA